MLDKELEETLNQAFREASTKRHQFLTVEHLLLALLDNHSATNIIISCGGDIAVLRAELIKHIDETTPVIPDDDYERETKPDYAFQRVIQRAVFHVQSAGKDEVNGANVLAAIFHEQNSHAVFFLQQENITRLDVVSKISHGIPPSTNPFQESEHFQQSMQEEDGETSTGSSPIEAYAKNLNEAAMLGQIDPLVGRQSEVARAIQVLCRRRKNNPLLVGEAGVGKTAIAEGLAKMIVENKVPQAIAHCTVYCLDLGSLLAGTKYRGDFEKRFKSLLQHLKADPGAILFIDEIHTIIGAGAASGGVMDASNLLKPLLGNGTLKCMGSTTYQEYRGIFEKDRALARRFQKIDVVEPTVQETFEILKGLKAGLEKHHQVKFATAALKAAAELSARYLTERFLPDKAIDVVDEAGAFQALQPTSKRKKVITPAEIEQVVASIARIPAKTVSRSDREVLKHLDRDLKMLVYGQDEAISTLVTAIKLSRSGLGNTEKPVGSFLFAGPTGVGKTEVTRQLANVMGVQLVRFDMSEYMEQHTVSRLIGAPPGYVGYDQGGLLTEAINKHPYCVLLLDEIEKAHPDVFNLLLQVMDYGILTDNNGRKSDFRHVVLVLTTNAGAQEMSRRSLGFTEQDHGTDGTEVLNRMFTPEFRNRLDSIIQFKSLDESVIRNIVDKFIMELEVELEHKHVSFHVDQKAREWLSKNGYNKAMGARPMARLIQEKVKIPLAEELLFGKLADGGSVSVTADQSGLKFTYNSEIKSHSKDKTIKECTNHDPDK